MMSQFQPSQKKRVKRSRKKQKDETPAGCALWFFGFFCSCVLGWSIYAVFQLQYQRRHWVETRELEPYNYEKASQYKTTTYVYKSSGKFARRENSLVERGYQLQGWKFEVNGETYHHSSNTDELPDRLFYDPKDPSRSKTSLSYDGPIAAGSGAILAFGFGWWLISLLSSSWFEKFLKTLAPKNPNSFWGKINQPITFTKKPKS